MATTIAWPVLNAPLLIGEQHESRVKRAPHPQTVGRQGFVAPEAIFSGKTDICLTVIEHITLRL